MSSLFKPAVGLLLIAQTIWVPRAAYSGDPFLETIGISIAVGTVLGASTLPFYGQPGDHLINAAYGAAAGAAFGLGVWVYGQIQGNQDDEWASARRGRETDVLRTRFSALDTR